MSAFAQTLTGDLDISTGNLVIVTAASQVGANKLSNLFGLAKGEWFRDTRLGVPYIQFVFVKNPNLQLISSIFQRIIRLVPEVASVDDIELDYNPSQRTLDATFQATSITGDAITGGLKKPFIVLSDQAGS